MRGEGDVNKEEARKCYMKEFNLRINTYQPAECAGMERNIVKFTTVVGWRSTWILRSLRLHGSDSYSLDRDKHQRKMEASPWVDTVMLVDARSRLELMALLLLLLLLRDTENDREIIQIYFCGFRTRSSPGEGWWWCSGMWMDNEPHIGKFMLMKIHKVLRKFY